MQNSQLIISLRSLSKKEFKEFGRFVRSPYFNNREEVVRFYDSIKKYHPAFNSARLNEETVFFKVYPGRKFSGVLLRKLNSLLLKQVMDYLAVSSFSSNELEFNVRLIDRLREKKLDTIFEKKAKQIEKLFSSSKQNFPYGESKFKYTTILNGFYMTRNERSMVNNFQNEIDLFTEYFLGVALLLYIRLGEWERVYSVKFDLKFYNEVINYFRQNTDLPVSISKIYYNMLMMLNDGDEKYFYELQKLREEFSEKLTVLDDFNIRLVSMQYYYRRVNNGDASFGRHQFNIIKSILERDLIPAGYIEPYFFTNAVRNAANIAEFEWAESFIKKYRTRLNPDSAAEICEYSFALVEFSRGNYELALKHFSKINLEISTLKIEIKNLLLAIYYELGYREELDSLIDSHKHYLVRDKKLSDTVRTASTAYVNMVSELVKLKFEEKGASIHNLKKNLKDLPFAGLKHWLIKKTQEFD
jgi:hypothetical protein